MTDGMGLFFDAKASALARMMQFTTISGMKSPSAASIAGKNALIRSSTAVTKPEIITIYDAMRICFGMIFLTREIMQAA